MTARTFRSLAHLQNTASTARVLNLLRIRRICSRHEDWAERPMFRTPALNHALIIKHRLRRDELDLFHGDRRLATKVVIPIDADDLEAGGRYLFVNERLFERLMADGLGVAPDHPDIEALRLIDALPSLDPFLLREQLRRGGFDPAPCYFDIGAADLDRMADFVEREITPLVALSFGDVEVTAGSTSVLAAKILSNDPGDRMEALGATLNLAPEQYQEGMFCWKGFLYYKWCLAQVLPEAMTVAEAVLTARSTPVTDAHIKAQLTHARASLNQRIIAACKSVAQMLKVYDAAYASLTVHQDPNAFRDFLLDAPSLFKDLGERLGVIQHIASYWRFRFAPGSVRVRPEELLDILMEFEVGLAGRGESLPPRRLAALDLAA